MISAATLESYLSPSTMPRGRSGEVIPQSGAPAQAYFGYTVTRTLRFGRPNSRVSVRSTWIPRQQGSLTMRRADRDFVANLRRDFITWKTAWRQSAGRVSREACAVDARE